MYLPRRKTAAKANPLKIKMAKRHLVAIGGLTVLTSILGGYYVVGKIQERSRTSDAKIDTSRNGKKVVIVGGGAAGCAVASMLTMQDADINVVVFEPQRYSKLQSMVPLAHVGHRSYDLGTNARRDTLYSPTTWNVTRDAKLVLRRVVSVSPTRSVLTDSDGVEHSYDALIIAAGSEPDYGAVNGLSKDSYNKHCIGQESFATRDALSNLYKGAVIHAKIPPRPAEVLFQEALAQNQDKLSASTKQSASWWSRMLKRSTSASEEIAPQQDHIKTTSSTSAAFDVPNASSWVGQQHCGTFMSTTNTLWKYLDYFRKLPMCPLTVVTSEATAADGLPDDFVGRVEDFWKERGVHFQPNTLIDRVDVANKQCYLKSTDSRIVPAPTSMIPFRLLVLDLPRKAPNWIATCGMSKPDKGGFVDVDATTLQHHRYPNIFAIGDCAAIPTDPSYGAVFSQAPVVTHNVRQFVNRRPMTAQYDGYSSFNVVMSTWRHMWPEVSWPARHVDGEKPQRVSRMGLARRNEHVWDNSSWRDVRGFLNGVYVQWFGLELMHWFVFLRAGWYPPHWFQLPIYPEQQITTTPAQGRTV